jgi:hypothetical protein
VTVTDVLSHDQIHVQVPIGVAASVCGVQAANVLAQGGLPEPIDCTAATTADLPVAFAPRSASTETPWAGLRAGPLPF